MSWTDDRVEQLKKLWADGLSASQIASKLGEVTRNAVIGKVHRLGLAGRATTSRVRTARPQIQYCPLPRQILSSPVPDLRKRRPQARCSAPGAQDCIRGSAARTA